MIDLYKLEEIRNLTPSRFAMLAAEKYGIDQAPFARFLEDYDAVPKGSLWPEEDLPVEASMTEIAREADLPIKVVGRLQDLGVIGRPILYSDLFFLKTYRKVWANIFLLRCQMAGFSRSQREDLVKRPTLVSKWERWAYARSFFNQIDYDRHGRMLNPKDRIFIEDMAEQIQELFGVPKCETTLKRLAKIKEYANNDKKRVSKGAITKKEVLANRSIPETYFDLEIELCLLKDDPMYS